MKKTDTFQTSNAEMVTISRAEYEKFQGQEQQLLALNERLAEMEQRIEGLMEALRLANHKRFGASSEKSEDTLMEQLSFLFNEAEVFAAAAEAEKATEVAAHKRRKKNNDYTMDSIPEDLPVERIEHRLEVEDLLCPACGDTMTEIGTEVVNKLRIIPAQVVIEQHVYYSYAGYHDLGENVTLVGCWAHARRKFDDAIKSLPKGKVKGSSAYQGLVFCDLLFAIEKGLTEKNATAEERYKERLEQAKPVLDAMFAWANSIAAAPKSALGKALTYLKNQWPYLTGYLKDGRLELSNNRAERSIKPFVISRKNFLFANTPKGASGSAVMFSLIQTAIENGLDPYRYLTWLMKMAKDADLEDAATVQTLLPWNAPEECRVHQRARE